MFETILQFFSSMPYWLATMLIAMLPIAELRLALPVAILVYKLPIWQALFFSVLGDMIPTTIILVVAKYVHQWLSENKGLLGRIWKKSLARAEEKFNGKYEKYGLIGLAIFVAIPLPFTGAWTGALAAFVFGLPFFKSWVSITLGVIISAIIVLLLTLAGVAFI